MKFQYFLVALFLSTSVATANVGTFDLNNYRLPTWAFPAEYYLNIDLRWPENDTFRAYTWININITEPNHYEVVLNVDPLYIDLNTSTIKVDTAEFICSDLDFSNETEIMVLSCMYDRYSNNTQYTQFEMYYTGKFSEYNSGLYKHSYEINGTTQTVIFTQFEEISFRKVFPSFDEPGYKAPISLSIDHYENLTVASNMPSRDDSNGLRESYIETVFNTTPPMSTYLLALVAGDSSVWSNTLIDYGHTKIFHQQIHKDYISVASDNALNLIDLMGEWTGIEYKDLGNPTMTLAALPGMAGAMENWGLITFGEGIIVDEGNRTTSKSIKNTITIMAHELSHQWFGDYVTLNWWSETWLNEGFASYFEWYLSDMLSTEENDYEFDKLFITAELQWALKADGPDAPPLSNNDSNVNTPLEISNCFGTISYAKGGSVLRMLRYALGEDVFQTGVREYLKAKALGNAKASDLLEHLQAALPDTTDIDLPTYMDSWIYQPDYPVVRTSIGEATSDFYLVSLDIYKYSPTLNETKDQNMSIWWVPISYITSDNPDPNNATYYWINPGRTFGFYVPTDESSWGIVNAGATGLYRVDYDPQTLERIINALNNNYSAIATENRAQLLDDVFNIAKFYTVKSEGYSDRPYQNAFKLAEYLKYETEYIPWYTYLQEVQYLLDEIQDDLTEEKLKEDVLALIEPQLLIPDSTNNISAYALNEMFKRNLLLDWASRLGQADAVAYVKSEYPKFLKDPESIDSNYRDIIICNGIRASDDPTKDYSTLMNLYSKSILPQERDDIAIGAACAPRSDLLKGYLASTLTAVPLVDKQYWANIFKTMSSKSSEGLDAALYFIVNHIDEISQKWRKVMTIETLLSTVSSKIVKQEQIKMLQSLLTKNSLSPSVTKAIKSAIDKAYVNIEWIDKMGTEITSILVYNGDDVPTTTTTEEIPTSTTTEEIPTTTDSKGVMTISNIIVILSFALLSKQIL